MKVLVTQSCLTLCDPMDCSLPGSSVHRILQARILEWVVIPFFGGIFPAQGLNPGLEITSSERLTVAKISQLVGNQLGM